MKRFAAALGAGCLLLTLGGASVSYKTLHMGEKEVWDAKVSYPSFGRFSNLSVAASQGFKKEANRIALEFSMSVKKDREASEKQLWVVDAKSVVSLKSPTFISGYFDGYQDCGGAHPSSFYHVLNFGTLKGSIKELKLKDILKKPTDVDVVIQSIVVPAIQKAKDDRGAGKLDEFDRSLDSDFVVTKSGLTWMFAADEVGSHAEGGYEIKVPWAKLKPYLRTDVGLPIR